MPQIKITTELLNAIDDAFRHLRSIGYNKFVHAYSGWCPEFSTPRIEFWAEDDLRYMDTLYLVQQIDLTERLADKDWVDWIVHGSSTWRPDQSRVIATYIPDCFDKDLTLNY